MLLHDFAAFVHACIKDYFLPQRFDLAVSHGPCSLSPVLSVASLVGTVNTAFQMHVNASCGLTQQSLSGYCTWL